MGDLMNNYSQINNLDKRKAKEINLKELFTVLKRRFWVILIITLLATAVGFFFSQTSKLATYQTSSRIIIGADEESRKTLQVIIRDSTILDKVIKELQLNRSSGTLAGQITVNSVDNSQVVSISVIDSDPVMASRIANTTARIFKDEVPNIVGKDYIRLLSSAKVNSIPINQNQSNKVMMAVIMGVLFGIGLAFLFESLDDKIRSEKEIETLLGLPMLGKISKMSKKNIKKKKNMQFDLELRGETIGYK